MRNANSPKQRRKILAQKLRTDNLDCALISNPKHILYFTGFRTNLNLWLTLMRGSRSTSFLAIDDSGRAYLLLGSSELPRIPCAEQGHSHTLDDVTFSTYVDYDLDRRMLTYADSLTTELRNWLRKLRKMSVKFRRVGIEDWHLASIYRELISSTFRGARFSGISQTILRMRRRKGTDEISYIGKATEIIEYAYRSIANDVGCASSELDLYRKMNYETFGKYGPFAWIMGIDVERAEARFSRGDTVILDLQAAFHSYWSDLCRTYVVGNWNNDQKKGLALLIEAKEEGEKLLRPGTRCKDIYAAMSQILVKGGFKKLPHHAGHGIGLDDQEFPFLIPGSNEEIEEGDVCVLEPGIYSSSIGGMRVEDCYTITPSGPKKISNLTILPGQR